MLCMCSRDDKGIDRQPYLTVNECWRRTGGIRVQKMQATKALLHQQEKETLKL